MRARLAAVALALAAPSCSDPPPPASMPVTPARTPPAGGGPSAGDPFRPPPSAVPDAAARLDAGADAAAAPLTPPPVDAAAPVDRPAPPPDVAMAALPPVIPGVWWKPRAGATWDWQLRTPIDPTHDVEVYDIDLFENGPEVIADLHARGKKVICYVNMGAWESWRPDAALVPKELLGAQYHGFPDEHWLDIRRIDLLSPMVHSRLAMARNKGCDAVEPDNMDGYDTNAHEPSGFPLTYIHQIVYNRFVASQAHARGLAVGLKNDVHQVEDLVNDFDFHVSEQCFEHNECDLLLPFIKAGKPVFEAEYVWPPAMFCAQAKAQQISAIKKKVELDAWRELCP